MARENEVRRMPAPTATAARTPPHIRATRSGASWPRTAPSQAADAGTASRRSRAGRSLLTPGPGL
jgi:hypothetical protein